MTDNHDSHYRENTSSANSRFEVFLNEMSLVMRGAEIENLLKERNKPMTYIPKTNEWHFHDWCRFWGETPENMDKKLKAIKYEPLKFGHLKMVDAEKFWECFYASNKADTPRKKKSGD
ncbi:hypothetical protein [Gimesia chilikensis]|uniref:hypothetical protein n=1 Tax=Gimesia chilikensis TaxID=2605989 RepID=UPI003A939542